MKTLVLRLRDGWPLALSVALLGALVVLTTGCASLMPKIGNNAASSQTVNGGVVPVPLESTDPSVWLQATDIHGGRHKVDCIRELLPVQYSQGLSGPGVTHGALFTFKPPVAQSFWMKNTPTRLVIYWIDKNGKLLGSEDMEPNTTTLYTPPAPISAAIELPAELIPDYGISGLTLGAKCVPGG